MGKKRYGILLAVVAGISLGACGNREGETVGEMQEAAGMIKDGQQETATRKEAGGEEKVDRGNDPGSRPGKDREDKYDREKLTWELVWSDEFDYEGAPDPEKWGYDVGGGGWGNDELQYYTEGGNAVVKDGCLVIEARKESMGGREYTSGRLVTRGKRGLAVWQDRDSCKAAIGAGDVAGSLDAAYGFGIWPVAGLW